MVESSPTIAILSGKGGTGKTFIAVNLAASASAAYYLDCDVEEPNGHLFLQPEDVKCEPVTVLIPTVDKQLCSACRRCVEFCKFNALALVLDQLLVFEEICHSCGGCLLVCPQGALEEKKKEIGRIERGKTGNVEMLTGILNTGEITGVPIIEQLLKIKRKPEVTTFIDCPPGAACSVLESIVDADYCLIVVEPTSFGLHNFRLVYELTRCLGKKAGVVVNKWWGDYEPVKRFCREQGISILAEIPYDSELARLNNAGKIVAREKAEYAKLFAELLALTIKEATHEAITNS